MIAPDVYFLRTIVHIKASTIIHFVLTSINVQKLVLVQEGRLYT